MIRKVKNKKLWKVLSHDGRRSFGVYDSLKKAKARLRQVEYFKRRK